MENSEAAGQSKQRSKRLTEKPHFWLAIIVGKSSGLRTSFKFLRFRHRYRLVSALYDHRLRQRPSGQQHSKDFWLPKWEAVPLRNRCSMDYVEKSTKRKNIGQIVWYDRPRRRGVVRVDLIKISAKSTVTTKTHNTYPLMKNLTRSKHYMPHSTTGDDRARVNYLHTSNWTK